MVDIHTHLLPGLDDGAQTKDDFLQMAAIAADSGVDTIVCTPHSNMPGIFLNYDSEKIKSLFRECQELLVQKHIPIHLRRGMEIFATPDIQEKIKDGRLIPINNSRYYLVEFAFGENPAFMRDTLYGLLDMGLWPIIAHPERYDCIQDFPPFLYEWVQAGVHAQVNRGSFFGRFGENAAKTVNLLLEHNIITCIASDAHSPQRRTPYMADIRGILQKEFSEELAIELLDRNPRSVVEGKTIHRKPLIPFRIR